MPMRTRRRASCTACVARLNGRVTSTRRRPRRPFFTSMLFKGEPSSGIGAGLKKCMYARFAS